MVGMIAADCLETLGMEGLVILDGNYWCSTMPVGDYPFPNSDDCTQASSYVNCFDNQGIMNGQPMTCDSGLFDPATSSCGTDYVCEL
jgi:hypothetical protein